MHQFWVALCLPFAYLVIWVLFIWPVTWAVQKYIEPGRLKDALLRKRWTHW